MKTISEYMNGDRRAVVSEAVRGFSVTMYVAEKVVVSIVTVASLNQAEDLAEDFISTGQSTSQFLSEKVNG
jgi:hypothetical protein